MLLLMLCMYVCVYKRYRELCEMCIYFLNELVLLCVHFSHPHRFVHRTVSVSVPIVNKEEEREKVCVRERKRERKERELSSSFLVWFTLSLISRPVLPVVCYCNREASPLGWLWQGIEGQGSTLEAIQRIAAEPAQLSQAKPSQVKPGQASLQPWTKGI